MSAHPGLIASGVLGLCGTPAPLPQADDGHYDSGCAGQDNRRRLRDGHTKDALRAVAEREVKHNLAAVVDLRRTALPRVRHFQQADLADRLEHTAADIEVLTRADDQTWRWVVHVGIEQPNAISIRTNELGV